MQTSIYLATPCYGGQAFVNYVASVLALQRECSDRKVGLQVDMQGGDALISRARGRMAGTFLADPVHTHLLFVDADIGFKPEQVFRLVASDRDVIGGVYPLKQINWDRAKRAIAAGREDIEAASLGYVVRFLPSPTNSAEIDENGYGAVAYVGTGFLMVKRSAMQRLADAHPELQARHRDMGDRTDRAAPMLFETMIEAETGQYLSEDYAFCRRWRDLGGEIYADFRGRFSHAGYKAYEGGLEQAQLPA
ncbi:hypothetical protein ACSBM8_05595 [Sphingomonas sp. ASY06-1R]|uniref:hypothetical protein n=1 Tax=Sphingomonas sp. ASY06-1R TaxID=3445771 RepID=UPI003FA23C53